MSVSYTDDRWPTGAPGNGEGYSTTVPVAWALNRHTGPEWETKDVRWRNDASLPKAKLVDDNTQFISVDVKLPRDVPALSQPCNVVRTFGEGVQEQYYAISGSDKFAREEVESGYELSALDISKPPFHSKMDEAVESCGVGLTEEALLTDIPTVVAVVCGVSQQLTAEVGVQSGLHTWE